MIIWGRSSDRSGERRWHTAMTMLLIAAGLLMTLFTSSLTATVVMLTMVLVGAYSMKGPFWALVSGWLSSSTAAAGLAAIGAMANLIGSYALALMPLAALCTFAGISVLLIGRKRQLEQIAHPAAASSK